MFNVSVCALCGYVQCVGVWCVLVCVVCVVVVCRTHSQDHGIHIDVNVGATIDAHFLIKTQSRTHTVHDVCFTKPFCGVVRGVRLVS